MRIGILASVGRTLDAFFPEIIDTWRGEGEHVVAAAGTRAERVDADVIRGLTQSPSIANLAAPRALSLWIARHRLDVVVTNTATASALVRATQRSVPIVYFCHGLHWSENGPNERVWKGIESALLSRTRAAIVSNSEDYEWMSARLGHDAVLTMPFGVGVPIERFPRTPLPRLGSVPLKLAWIGDMTSRKRPALAVEVAKHLAAAGVEFELEMVGTGPAVDALEAQIRELGLTKQILLPGRLESSAVLARSHALIHTAEWEGLARVTLEAAAIGRNVYGFDVKGVRDAPSVSLARDGDAREVAAKIISDLRGKSFSHEYPEPDLLTTEKQSLRVLNSLRGWVNNVGNE
ncbi:glycosyltransferase [Mycetocola zhujimingii]|uniref:Uncharacterized protein n=1 Tax=Mycetocola zhujimingii TaxID=2079792 RepID=A0A2U1TFB0_9MICO|nr:glycosyltransferase [Mycetocola zhujimingii]PWC07588.1 hypothetical protein DF223_06020 [Mycetocola zhujimingii]